MNTLELIKARSERVEEIHAEFNLASYRTHMRVLRGADSDAGSDRWIEYLLCRPFWGTHWYKQPPPADKRKLA